MDRYDDHIIAELREADREREALRRFLEREREKPGMFLTWKELLFAAIQASIVIIVIYVLVVALFLWR